MRAFEETESAGLAKLVIVGHGELADTVRSSIATDSVEMLGFVGPERLEYELARASIGLVSQRADIAEFNVPSKLMNLMAKGLSVLAYVGPESETARIVSSSGGGWVASSAEPRDLRGALSAMFDRPHQLVERGQQALHYAREHFDAARFAEGFERVLSEVQVGG